jgi:lysophospholipase L1-like esterase
MKLNKNIKTKLLLISVFLAGIISGNAQDPLRFKEQVDQLANAAYNFSPNKKIVVFAGSSSIRMWKDVQTYFPEFNIINNGFGGSQFTDLIYYNNDLILKRNPDIVFIYEGDNDIASEKKPGEILEHAKKLVTEIKENLPETKIVIISPKPSIARKHLKKEYKKLNNRLKKYSKKQDNVEFADVWTAMHDENGNLYEDVFIQDGLHMNEKGYDIWAEVVGKYLD